MNLIELDRALKQLRLGGMAAVLETRLRQAQAEPLAPIVIVPRFVERHLPIANHKLRIVELARRGHVRLGHRNLSRGDMNLRIVGECDSLNLVQSLRRS